MSYGSEATKKSNKKKRELVGDEVYLEHKRDIQMRCYWKNLDWSRQYASDFGRTRRYELKRQVLLGYGHRCSCCGEDREEFLQVDHVNGVPEDERRSYAGKRRARISGVELYRKIISLGFPADYRLLCSNCNYSFGFWKYCPHQIEFSLFDLVQSAKEA